MRTRSPVRFVLTASIVAMVAATAGGCSSITSIANRDVTGSVSPTATTTTTPAQRSDADWRKDIDVYGQRYRNDPKDAEAALHYGTALRGTGQRAQAAAVLEQAAIANPSNRALIAAYGRALVDNGNYQQGFETLSRAHTPDNPDWHILSVQGTALDRLGRHEEARRYYNNALKIKPEEPSVLSNLGMSYLLSKQLANAEQALRRAHEGDRSNMRIRQNFALAVGLQGRVGEAESIVSTGLTPDEAAESVSALKQMLPRGDQPAARPARSAETARSARG
jgi:Flp pilus assembly protein TadD